MFFNAAGDLTHHEPKNRQKWPFFLFLVVHFCLLKKTHGNLFPSSPNENHHVQNGCIPSRAKLVPKVYQR
ncbi:MAG TPA: hypothetical protein DDW49_09720 [Deltaproteobacteria bacterium]|nr:MAG: hypothetical protein A2048_00630 [Deltaproteobacteria bacterium GWA2_45_12]HBF13640.1 hypothetical protein [Deltaproteobacteria bacterium]